MAGPARTVVIVAIVATAVIAGVVLVGRATPTLPFSVISTAPDGYAAVAELLETRGVQVVSRTPDELLETQLDPTPVPGRVVVVPVPTSLSADLIDALRGQSRDGGRVVFGSRPEGPEVPDELEALLGAEPMVPPGRLLTDEPAFPEAEGVCDLPELEDLGPVDAAFVEPVPVGDSDRSCYGDGRSALFVSPTDSGLVTMGGPLLWSNARLQPNKEDGGRALSNAATAVALLGDSDEVWFIDVSGGIGDVPGGTQDPIALLPLPVQLALAQLVGALLLYLWWRGRRLGRPPTEPLPVEIAGSELVVAVGDVLRRRSARQRAAGELRTETRRQLCRALGLGVDAPPEVLVARLTGPTGRSADELTDTLYGARELTGDAALVELAHRLDRIRQEVLDVRSVR